MQMSLLIWDRKENKSNYICPIMVDTLSVGNLYTNVSTSIGQVIIIILVLLHLIIVAFYHTTLGRYFLIARENSIRNKEVASNMIWTHIPHFKSSSFMDIVFTTSATNVSVI